MTVSRKTLSQVITLAFAINMNGVTTSEDISWLRREIKAWADSLLSIVGL
jgi:hypothetical protein